MHSRISLITLAFCLLTAPVLADTDKTFQQGVQQYKTKQYPQAIRSFLSAYKQGLRSAALYHNLALSYFQTGNYKLAQRYFSLEGRDPAARMSSEYGLGLVAQARGQTAKALKHYRRVVRESRNKKLAALAQMRINKLTGVSAKSWNAYFQAEYGRDDNVNADPSGVATRQADNYTSLYASGRYQISGSRYSGIAIDASAFKYDYSKINRYDMLVLGAGIEKTFTFSGWNTGVSIKQQKVSLGSADYQKLTKLELSTQHKLARDQSMRIRLRHDDIKSQAPAYNYLEGSRQRLRLAYRYFPAAMSLRLYYQYEQNDRQDTATQSYSPERNTAFAAYRYAVTPSFDLNISTDYRISQYPAKAVAAREDKRWRYRLKGEYRIMANWSAQLGYEYSDNRSSSATYTYDRNLYSLSTSVHF